MLNVFAYRSTDPNVIPNVQPVGEDNDFYILKECEKASKIIIAWGTHGKVFQRQDIILKLLGDKKLFCFGINSDGTPKHPLYLPNNVKIIQFR